MNTRYFDWIWHVRDSVELPAGQSHDEAMARLEPLFHERGTTYDRFGNSLSFGKKGQPAQDKMSVYDRGELMLETDAKGSRLRYHLVSRAFLYCFLAPLLFLAFAQMNTAISNYERAKAEAAGETDTDKKKEEATELPQSSIDKFLGAPTPEIPGEEDKEDKQIGPSPTPAYVFSVIFVVLFIAGRILEPYLVKRLFRRRLHGLDGEAASTPATPTAA